MKLNRTFEKALFDNRKCATASPLLDAGIGTAGEEGTKAINPDTRFSDTDGIVTESVNRVIGDTEFYTKEIDARLVNISPQSTPINVISKYAKTFPSKSFIVKYYSVGTRPISCTTSEEMEEQSTGASVALAVDDVNMFTIDDTIRVVGVPAVTRPNGTLYDQDKDTMIPDLVLCVSGRNEAGKPMVYAVNGINDSTNQSIWVPNIPAGTTLVRMGKACGELDAQTGRFNNLPTAEENYCQNFMMQIEQSTFDKIASKEVNWAFTDLEEDGIRDMLTAQENTYLFGVKNKIYHPGKDGMITWFTQGIWYMAGKDIEVGEWSDEKNCAVISDDNLVDISKDLFVGTDLVSTRKILFCGSDFLGALSKIQSDKFRLKDSVEAWNLKFKSWETDFGEVLTIHHQLFDRNDMRDCAFAMDPDFLTKRTHVSWSRNILDLKTAGIRNSNAVVLQEVACLYLRYANAHARLRLAQKPTVVTPQP